MMQHIIPPYQPSFRLRDETSDVTLIWMGLTGAKSVTPCIGTTTPNQKLHVEGQCVTGDTLISVVEIDNTDEQTQAIPQETNDIAAKNHIPNFSCTC